MKDPKEHWHSFHHILLYVTIIVTYFLLSYEEYGHVTKPQATIQSVKTTGPAATNEQVATNEESNNNGEESNKKWWDLAWEHLWKHLWKLRYYTPVLVLVFLAWLYRTWLWRKLYPETDFSGMWLSVAEYDDCDVHVCKVPDDHNTKNCLKVSENRRLLNIVRIEQTPEGLELTDGLALYPPQPFLYYSVAMVANWEWEVMHVSYEVDELDHTADQSSMERLKFYPPMETDFSIIGRLCNAFIAVIELIPLFEGISRSAYWSERHLKVNFMDGDFTRGRTKQVDDIRKLKWGTAYYVRIPDHLIEGLVLDHNTIHRNTFGFWDLPIPFTMQLLFDSFFPSSRNENTETGSVGTGDSSCIVNMGAGANGSITTADHSIELTTFDTPGNSEMSLTSTTGSVIEVIADSSGSGIDSGEDFRPITSSLAAGAGSDSIAMADQSIEVVALNVPGEVSTPSVTGSDIIVNTGKIANGMAAEGNDCELSNGINELTPHQRMFIQELLSRNFYNPGHEQSLRKIESELITYFTTKSTRHEKLRDFKQDITFRKSLILERIESWKGREFAWFCWGVLIGFLVFICFLSGWTLIASSLAVGIGSLCLHQLLLWKLPDVIKSN